MREVYPFAAAINTWSTRQDSVRDAVPFQSRRIRRAARHRARPGFGNTLYAAMTGFGHARDFAQTGRAGFEMHLVKPVELKNFEAPLLRARNR